MAKSGNSLIARLNLKSIGIFIDVHRPEFVTVKAFPVKAGSFLNKKYRAFGFQFNQKGDNWK